MVAFKTVFAPHLGRDVRFGRNRAVARGPRMHMKSYIDHRHIAVPESCDFSQKAMASLSNVYLNDRYGCCVVSGGYHVVGVETGNATGSPMVATDDQIVHDYSKIGGFDPNNPIATDGGCNEEVALNYWTQHGFANGTKLCGWLAVDPTNEEQVKQAMYLFENLFFGIELPNEWINPFPSTPGFVWDDGAPEPSNGHCVVGVGFSEQGVQIDTWGLLGTLTWKAIAHLCAESSGGGLYTMLSPDQVAKGATKAPNGFDWEALVADFDALGGNVPPPMVQVKKQRPRPGPPPSPSAQELRAKAREKAQKKKA